MHCSIVRPGAHLARRSPSVLAALFAAALSLQACKGESPADPPLEKPASLTYSSPTSVLTVGTAIAANNPSQTGGAIAGYTVSPALPAGLALDATSGVITGTPTAVASAATYTVTGANTAGSATAALSITVNDRAPATLAYAASPAKLTKGTAASLAPATTGGAVVSYAVAPALPAGLAINATTGVISGTPTALSASAAYTVTATNTGGAKTATVTIEVVDAAPAQLAYAGPLACTKGVACAAAAPAHTGGAVVTWAIAPALPAGLVLDAATGAIAGTPTALAPAANYTVTATNTGGATTAIIGVGVLDAAPTALTYASSTLSCTVGLTCALAAPSNAGGAVVAYSVAPALPAGLALDAATGAIAGTPTAISAAAEYVVTATNTGGTTAATIGVSVVDVAPSALTYASATLSCTAGTACSLAAPSSTGGAVVSYAVSPALPAGLALDAGTGAISGTPTTAAAAADFVVTATNSGGSTSATVSITVLRAPPSVSAPMAVDAPTTGNVGPSQAFAAASDGTTVLHVWGDDGTRGAGHLFAARLAADGTVLDNPSVVLSTATGASFRNVSVAWTGSVWFVCELRYTPSGSETSMGCRTLSADLSTIGPRDEIVTTVSGSNQNISGPALALNGDRGELFLNWILTTYDYATQHHTSPFLGVRFDLTGARLDAAPVVVKPAGTGFDYDRHFVSMTYGGGYYLMSSIEGGTGCGGYHLAVSRVKASDLSGGAIFAQMNPNCEGNDGGDMAYDSANNRFLVIVKDSPVYNTNRLSVVPLSNNAGDVTATTYPRIELSSTTGTFARFVRFAASGTSKLIAVSQNVASVQAYLLDSSNNLAATFTSPTLTLGAGASYYDGWVSPVKTASGWTLSISDNRAAAGIYAWRLTSALTTTDGEGIPGAKGAAAQETSCTASAGPGNGWLVAWLDRRSGPAVYARAFASDGTPKGDAVRLGAAYSNNLPCRAGYSAGTYLVSWMGATWPKRLAARVDATTSAALDATPIVLGNGNGTDGSVTGGSAGFLATWDTSDTVASCGSTCSSPVMAAHIGLDGVVAEAGGFLLSDPTPLGSNPLQGMASGAYFDGTVYQTAYAVTVNYNTASVYKRIVPETSAVMAAPLLVVSTVTKNVLGPAIAPITGGGTVVAWTEYAADGTSTVSARKFLPGFVQAPAPAVLATGSGAAGLGAPELASDGSVTWLALVTGNLSFNMWGYLSATGASSVSVRPLTATLGTGDVLSFGNTGLSMPTFTIAGDGAGSLIGASPAWSSAVNAPQISVRFVK